MAIGASGFIPVRLTARVGVLGVLGDGSREREALGKDGGRRSKDEPPSYRVFNEGVSRTQSKSVNKN